MICQLDTRPSRTSSRFSHQSIARYTSLHKRSRDSHEPRIYFPCIIDNVSLYHPPPCFAPRQRDDRTIQGVFRPQNQRGPKPVSLRNCSGHVLTTSDLRDRPTRTNKEDFPQTHRPKPIHRVHVATHLLWHRNAYTTPPGGQPRFSLPTLPHHGTQPVTWRRRIHY